MQQKIRDRKLPARPWVRARTGTNTTPDKIISKSIPRLSEGLHCIIKEKKYPGKIQHEEAVFQLLPLLHVSDTVIVNFGLSITVKQNGKVVHLNSFSTAFAFNDEALRTNTGHGNGKLQ